MWYTTKNKTDIFEKFFPEKLLGIQKYPYSLTSIFSYSLRFRKWVNKSEVLVFNLTKDLSIL